MRKGQSDGKGIEFASVDWARFLASAICIGEYSEEVLLSYNKKKRKSEVLARKIDLENHVKKPVRARAIGSSSVR